jgi:hypothetical protein
MTPATLLSLVVRPTLQWLGPPYASREAEVMLLAIAGQESRCSHRCQTPTGPARSLWQIEPPTARAVYDKWGRGRAALNDLSVPGPAFLVDEWLRWSDLAACVIARGILWLEPSPLPAIGDQQGAWTYYAERCWRPGKPHPETWAEHYRAAMEATA